jgi:hypothetical protein
MEILSNHNNRVSILNKVFKIINHPHPMNYVINLMSRANDILMIEMDNKIDYGYIEMNCAIKINNI